MVTNSRDCRDSLSERFNQIIHGGVPVSRGQWREVKPEFQELQDRDGFVFRVVNLTAARQWRDDDRGNANTGAPTVGPHGRRNVIPAAAILIVCHDDRARIPDVAVSYGVDDIGNVLLACHNIGVARMFIVDAGKFNK